MNDDFMQLAAEQARRKYGESIVSGRIMYSEYQWSRLYPHEVKEDFRPIVVDIGCTMYRYKYATMPYHGRELDVSTLDPEDMYDGFKLIVNNFIIAFNEGYETNLVNADEDDDFTYGAFCTALATCIESETDWLLTHEYGSVYSIRSIKLIELEGN